MKILKWLLIAVVVLIVAAVGTAFMLPDTSHVERSTTIAARPATVFAVINGYRQFNKWSPWADKDPNTKYQIEGPMTGVGAKQSWQSEDPNVGSGSQEIVESVPNRKLKTKLVFADFPSDNWAELSLTPEGESTRLLWTFDMNCNGSLMCRCFGVMMDSMLGPDYEHGLAKLKSFAETLPKDDFSDLQAEVVETRPVTIAYASGEASTDQAAARLGELYAKVLAFIKSSGANQSSAPMAITRAFDDKTKFWKFDAALPVDKVDLVAPPDSEVKVTQTYAGKAIKVTHKGAYAAMEPTYAKLIAFKSASGFEDNGNSWEHYISDAKTTPEADLVTYIYWPVK